MRVEWRVERREEIEASVERDQLKEIERFRELLADTTAKWRADEPQMADHAYWRRFRDEFKTHIETVTAINRDRFLEVLRKEGLSLEESKRPEAVAYVENRCRAAISDGMKLAKDIPWPDEVPDYLEEFLTEVCEQVVELGVSRRMKWDFRDIQRETAASAAKTKSEWRKAIWPIIITFVLTQTGNLIWHFAVSADADSRSSAVETKSDKDAAANGRPNAEVPDPVDEPAPPTEAIGPTESDR